MTRPKTKMPLEDEERSVIQSKIFWIGVTILGIYFAPGLVPEGVEFEERQLPVLPKFEGGLEPNFRLEEAEIFLDDPDVLKQGPESFAAHENFLYTGTQGGEILEIDLSTRAVRVLSKIGAPFRGTHGELESGRPLGLTSDGKGHIYVADSSFGLYKINVRTGERTMLVPSTLEIDGKRNMLTNSVTVMKDGTVFYTVSSTKFHLQNGMLETLSSGTGRLMEYDPARNRSEVRMDFLVFANGIALSPDEQFLLIVEGGAAKIWKYHLTGPKRGQTEVFAVTPGLADNIKPNGRGGYLVAIVAPIDPDHFHIGKDVLMRFPSITKFIAKFGLLVQSVLNGFNKYVYHVDVLERLSFYFIHFETFAAVAPKHCIVVELDQKGNFVQSWHTNKESRFHHFSEAFAYKGYMYLGSPWNYYIARIPYT